MDYKLAKQLKDAGFPQNRVIKNMHKPAITDGKGDICLNPTLSELIEACREDFSELINKKEGWEARRWGCCYSKRNWITEIGNTPEEAVAKLYL